MAVSQSPVSCLITYPLSSFKLQEQVMLYIYMCQRGLRLCHSAWSLPAVVGLTKHGGIDLAFSCVLLLCNIIMQVRFKAFSQPKRDEK